MSTLYLIATPIGNRDDFSYRAVEVLDSADVVACEDTRTSSKLFNYYKIDKPVFSFHQHNEHKKVDGLIERLNMGQTVALITDAGTPGISDPGFLASRAAHQAGHSVSAIPGPDAATTALVASGLPADKFIFDGFLPHKKGRQTQIRNYMDEERTVILFESPYRIKKLLKELTEQMDDGRWIAVCRELTKKFEEVIRGTLREVAEKIESVDKPKGEFVIVIAGCHYEE